MAKKAEISKSALFENQRLRGAQHSDVFYWHTGSQHRFDSWSPEHRKCAHSHGAVFAPENVEAEFVSDKYG